jgi:diguanylate cyclase (GGDEF)-like protein/PAS domain S-box-containing protein
MIKLILVAIACWLTVRLGFLFTAKSVGVASVWIGSGLTLAILLLSPKKQWSALLALFFIAIVAGNLSGGNSLLVSLGFALTNVLEIIPVAWGITYFCGSQITFGRVREILTLFVITIFSNGITALLGAAVSVLAFGAPLWDTWLVWWLGSGLGMVLVTPFIVTWVTSKALLQSKSTRQAIETGIITLGLAVFAWLLFGKFTFAEEPILRNYMLFPLLIWLSFRYTPRGMSGVLILVAAIATWNTLQGHGIFAFADQSMDQHLISLQIFLSVITFSGLFLSAVLDERRQSEAALLDSKSIAERYLNIVAEIIVSLDHEGNITHLNESGHQLLGYDAKELVGKNWFDTCLTAEEKGEVRRFFEMMKNGEIHELASRENSVVTKNGERKIILWHNTILRDRKGGFAGTLSSGEDITERMEMEKALRIALAKYKTLFESFPLGITITDEAGNVLETNPTAAKILTVSRDEHSRRSIGGAEWRILRPDGTLMPPEEYTSMRALRENHIIENEEQGIVKPDHSITWLNVTAAPLPLEGYGVVITYGDITARKRTEDLLQARLRISQFAESYTLDELLQKTLDEAEALTGSQIGFAHFVEADQKTLELQMWSTNTLKNMCNAEGKGQHYPVDEAGVWAECVYTRAPVIHNDYAGLPASRRKGTPEGHTPVIRELTVPVLRGDMIVAIFGVGNKPDNYTDADMQTVLQLANLTWDIIQRKRAEEALRESEARNRALVDAMPDLIFVHNRAGEYIDYHAAKSELLVTPPHVFLGRTPHDIFPPELAEPMQSKLNLAFQTGQIQTYEYVLNLADGRHYFEARINSYDNNRAISIIRNITERKQAEEALEAANTELHASLIREKQLAHTDMLTGVNNRRNLYELAAHELDIATRYRQPLSLVMFDLDHFKKVNDTFGHTVGDQILVQVTQATRAELRSTDTIGRYGGEEFIVLLPMTQAQQAFSLAERIRENVAKIRVSTPIGDASVTLSIGIVEVKQTPGQNESLDDLIRRADRVMYAAKQSGRNRTMIFNSDSGVDKPKEEPNA